MKYLTYVKRITEALKTYKAEIDILEKKYVEKKKEIKDKASEMSGKWTDEYIESFIEENNPDINFKASFQNARDKVEPIILDCFEKLHKSLDGYFNAPIKQDFSNKIMSIKLSGLQLSDLEFKILQDSATSYMERRLLNQLAESRTKKSDVVTLDENAKPQKNTVDVNNPYFYLELPNIEATYEAFNDYKRYARELLYRYSGANAEMVNLLDVDIPNYMSVGMDGYFRNNAEENFIKVLDKANSILSEHKQKIELSENDKKLIDTLIDSKYPRLARERVKALAEADEHIAGLLSLDERYSGFLDS